MKINITVIKLAEKLKKSFSIQDLKEILEINEEITNSFLNNKKVHDN